MDHHQHDCRTLSDRIDSLILDTRRLFFADGVDMETSKEAIRKLWYLEIEDPAKPIIFVINSPGGSINDGFAIWDQVKMLSCPVYTLVTGLAASMGSILSLCGAKGRRFATPYSRFMIHQPSISNVVRGQATDLEIHAKELQKTKDLIVDLYVKETGRDAALISKKIDRDSWMSAQEALDFGLIDKIVTSYEEILQA